ncbi:MAG TPA: ferritin-like domain-containing protein [Methylomirabilota bacterium]|nr:ferritin-like domain-containing protein [Methylomirabilota bacterium]
MPQGSTTLHESEERLSPQTRDMHRALVSLMEELEAVDWYQQRLEATDDAELREILRHNRDEEKEHAAMVLEWIRRRDEAFSAKLREFLFSNGPIVGRERALEAAPTSANGGAAVRLGSLRGGR